MFRVYCDNKGCGKDNHPLLNLLTDEAECSECGKVIKSITQFAKTQMKSLGQVKRNEKRDQAFAVQCKFCNKTAPPKVDDADNVVCSICNKHLNYLSTPYVNVIKQYLSGKPSK